MFRGAGKGSTSGGRGEPRRGSGTWVRAARRLKTPSAPRDLGGDASSGAVILAVLRTLGVTLFASSTHAVRVAALFAALALSVNASSTSAQSSEHDARRLFDEGVELLNDGRFSEALQRFERASVLREVPAVMLNLALAQRGVGHYVDAERSLARYLELARGRVDRDRATQVRELQSEIRSAIAHLTLRVEGDPSSVSLDGRALPRSEWSSTRALDPGEHVVELAGDAIEHARFPVTLARGQRLELPVRARPLDVRSRLTIEAPPEATVTLDRRALGAGRQEVMAAPGAHEVEVRREGYDTFRTAVTTLARRDERVVVVMRRHAESGSVLTRWWFWTGVGVLAAGTAAAVVYATRPTEPPETGSLRYAVGALVVW